MSRKRPNDSEFLAALGPAFEIFATLQRLGVRDADWRLVLSSPEQAAEVAAALRARTYSIPLPTRLFDEIDPAFERSKDLSWADLGENVRGAFHLVCMNTVWEGLHGLYYQAASVTSVIEQEMARSGLNLRPATAYELAVYAGAEWDKRSAIVAFGSMCSQRRNGGYAWISGEGTSRIARIADGLTNWRRHEDFVLCVSV
jgi:hypothetical protein